MSSEDLNLSSEDLNFFYNIILGQLAFHEYISLLFIYESLKSSFAFMLLSCDVNLPTFLLSYCCCNVLNLLKWFLQNVFYINLWSVVWDGGCKKIHTSLIAEMPRSCSQMYWMCYLAWVFLNIRWNSLEFDEDKRGIWLFVWIVLWI